ncbi:hypothetical protein F5144DRAFT_596585 [Chaetomium tenue]|uniref:Uncharacterized protein n=1 Tax=Chaetomium tenue TaxID=1854479 RepID=A0ACB7NVW0_9PEZI|nr:hypothetical protein F5144DRAFT_596585 [Chaetomium globosum]
MPIADDPSFERRQWGGRGRNNTPWWCNFWPPACSTSTSPGTPSGGSTPSSTTKTPIRAPTTTSPRATVPQHTPPVATRPPAVPPAATQSPKPSDRPQPVPSSTSQPRVPSPMPPPTDTEKTSAQTASVAPVFVQPGGNSGNKPGNDDDNRPPGGDSGSGTGTGDGNDDGGSNGTSGSGHGDPGSSTANRPTQSGVSSVPAPLATSPSSTGGIGGGNTGTTVNDKDGTSGGGLAPGAIAGIVVGLLLLLALLALLLYKFRRSAAVQRMLAPFRKLGGQSRGSPRVDTPGGDGMGRTLISPAPTAAAASTAGGAAAALAARNRSGRGGQSQPPMRQTGRLHPHVAPAPGVGRDSNRVSTFTYDSVATTGFTPSPVSPVSAASMLSPGTVRTSHPIQAPPDPRIIASTNAHVTRGSMSSQMAWPMPPGTPPAIQHPDGPQYLDFEQSGETVVRINQPPRGNRRSGGF